MAAVATDEPPVDVTRKVRDCNCNTVTTQNGSLADDLPPQWWSVCCGYNDKCVDFAGC